MDIVRRLTEREHFRLIICGSTDEGKTYLSAYLLNRLLKSGNYSSVYIFGQHVLERAERTQGNPLGNPYLSYLRRENSTVTEDFDPDELMDWIAGCKEVGGKHLLVMDDIVIYRLNVGKNDKIISSIFSSCRHAGISVISVIHSYTGLGPTARQQISHFIFTSVSRDSYTKFMKGQLRMKKKISDNDIMGILSFPRFTYLFFDPRARVQLERFNIPTPRFRR